MQSDAGGIYRIGRAPNPAERTYQYVMENAHVLLHATRNQFGAERGVFGIRLDEAWDALSPAERAWWTDRTIAVLKHHADSYVDREDPEYAYPQPNARPNISLA